MRVKYVLKNKELVNKIRYILGDDVIAELETQVKKCIDNDTQIYVYLTKRGCPFSFEKSFSYKDFDKQYVYSGDNWNHFPQIQPPQDIWMRCKYHSSGTETYLFIAKYVIDEETKEGKWIDYERNEHVTVHSYMLWNPNKDLRKTKS